MPACRLLVTRLEDRTTPVVAFALSGSNLLAFDTATPAVTLTTAITNVAAAETLVGIDFRPQNGHLYSLGVNATGTGTLYDISTRTGRATPVGATGGVTTTDGLPNPATAGTGFAFDFNPVADVIRVMATDGDNFAIDPNTGTTLANQTTTGALLLTGTSYTNNAPNATATTEYAISATNGSLYRITNPADPAANNVLIGGLGLSFNALNGFDIPAGVNVNTSGNSVTTGTGFAALTVGGSARFYSVNLVTGAATLIGTIGGGTSTIGGLAIQNDYAGFPAVGVSNATPGAANLVRFNTSTPGTSTSVAVSGLAAGDTLVGIAFRPSTGQLYGLGVTAAGAGTLYRINPQSGAATPVGAVTGMGLGALPNPATATSGYGFAFNATVDAIRVVTTAGQSFAVSPTTGAVLATAPAISGATTTVDAVAYTNSFGQTTGVGGPTTVYALDSASDTLYIQNAGTNSTMTAVAPVTLNGAPLNFTQFNGFDIPAGVVVGATGAPATGFGYATLVVGGTPSLYRINLATGAATNFGALGTTVSGLTLADSPGGTISFQSATVSGNEGGSVTVVLTRTAATGPQTATVTATGGTATVGTDFTAGPYTVTFADGATTAAFNISVPADLFVEGDESVVLTLSAAPGAALGSQPTTTLTVTDTTPPVAPSRNLAVGGVNGQASLFAATPAGQYSSSPSATLTPVPGYAGAVRTAGGDVNGDGTPDLILVTGPGTPIRLAVISGVDNSTVLVSPFDPFGGDFSGGGFVAAADIDRDGRAEFVVTPDEGGGPRVTIFSLPAGATATVRANFLGIDDANFRGGARAALGDVNGDGTPDIAVSAGFLGGPRTAIFNGTTLFSGTPVRLVSDFFAFPGPDATTLRNGVFVAAGDVDGDAFADLIFGGGPGGAPRVFILSGARIAAGDVAGAQANPVANFFVANNSTDRGGVRLAAKDADGDARADVVAGSGEGAPGRARVYLGKNFVATGEPTTFQDLDLFGGAVLPGGVFVG